MKRIDETDEVFVIAEIGGNHEGSLEVAKDYVHLAASAGADSIKFQIYSGDTLVNVREDPDRVRHFDRFALKDKDYIELAELCVRLDVDFNASIWNERQIDLMDPYLSFYKIGSGDLTAYPLIKKIASKKKPIVISTGLADWNEVMETLNYVESLDSIYKQRNMVTILQCTSMYPIPNRDANLSVIKELISKTNHKIGYSDHTTGNIAVETAVALGAEVLEVHFTDSRADKEFRDHLVSFTPDELKTLKENTIIIRELLGDGVKRPMTSEIETDHVTSFRRALYPKKEIYKDQVVTEDDLVALRPMHGLDANKLEKCVGKRANKDLQRLQVLSEQDFY